ncbi:crossover junction endodeoxyribonuclease RuvC [bacterium]|nr:MAG: crossover junction endodeoxyribonuclease RuvC [bacterium]
MIILGIDPGNVRTGYGLIEKSGGKLTYVESGLLKIPPRADSGKQLLALENDLKKLIKKMSPRVVGLEKIFLGKNKKTGIFVAQARGLILKILAENESELIELSPPSVKLAVSGDGRADKRAVAKMVGLFLNIKTLGLLDDETDALAIAIAASSQTGGPSRDRTNAGD